MCELYIKKLHITNLMGLNTYMTLYTSTKLSLNVIKTTNNCSSQNPYSLVHHYGIAI